MVNLLLCKSALFQNTVTAVADILGGVGESFMNQCSPSKFVPHLILHGQNDPIITYYNDNLVDNSKFISTCEPTQSVATNCASKGAGVLQKWQHNLQNYRCKQHNQA